MNLMPIIAKELGVEMGEKFRITCYGNTEFVFRACFQLADENQNFDYDIDEVFHNLCLGINKVVKLPWKPQLKEIYYYVSGTIGDPNLYVHASSWWGDTTDVSFYKLGNVFKTEEEAEAHKQEVWERLTKEVEKC